MRSTWTLQLNLISLPMPLVGVVASAVKKILHMSEASVSHGKFQSALRKHSLAKFKLN